MNSSQCRSLATFVDQYLTRFNKIAIYGIPQMAVDKEAIICLSRVYSNYFKCNLPLFYVYPALTIYLSILLLTILTLLACTHSSDNLFHTLMVICEKVFCAAGLHTSTVGNVKIARSERLYYCYIHMPTLRIVWSLRSLSLGGKLYLRDDKNTAFV